MRIIDTISAGLDPDEIAQGVATIITEATATDVCFVHLIDDSGRTLSLRGATPPFDRTVGQVGLALGEGVAGWVAAHREPVVITEDKFADWRYKYLPELRGECYTSLASVPILTRHGHLIGVLNVHTRQRREFTDSDVELLDTVAGLMAGAIENAELHQRLAEREAALERFTEQMVELQESERRRLAGEIHDGISQRIVSITFHLSAAHDLLLGGTTGAEQQIEKAQDLAAAALAETRSAIAGLRPPVLDDLGLADGLESLANATPGLAIRVDADHCALPEHIETALYRVAQEALQNVVKHAQAETAEMWLRSGSGRVLLEICDDGQGFDPEVVEGGERGGHYGLAGIRERAQLLGGKLEILNTERGTTLRLSVPLPKAGQPSER